MLIVTKAIVIGKVEAAFAYLVTLTKRIVQSVDVSVIYTQLKKDMPCY